MCSKAAQTTTRSARRSGTFGTINDMAGVGLGNEQWMICAIR